MYTLRYKFHEKDCFLLQDGMSTFNKSAAKLFDTVDEAREFIAKVRDTTKTKFGDSGPIIPVDIVEVEIKPVLKKIGNVVEVV